MSYTFDPRAELSMPPAQQEDFYAEGPDPAHKHFLGASTIQMRRPIDDQDKGITLEAIFHTVNQAFDYAKSLGHAVMHFKTDGWITVWPITAFPTLAELQYLVDGHIEDVYLPKFGSYHESHLMAYANQDGLGVYPDNPLLTHLGGAELFCGPAVMIVGCSVDQYGDEYLVPKEKLAWNR